jgi:hypothetical protein
MVSLAEKDELRMFGNIVDCAIDEINLNMPVEVVFDDVTEDCTLLKWRPVR